MTFDKENLAKETLDWTKRQTRATIIGVIVAIIGVIVAIIAIIVTNFSNNQTDASNSNINRIKTPDYKPAPEKTPIPSPSITVTPTQHETPTPKPTLEINTIKQIQLGETLTNQKIPMNEPFAEYKFNINSDNTRIVVSVSPDTSFKPIVQLLNTDKNLLETRIKSENNSVVLYSLVKFEGEYFIRVRGQNDRRGKFNIYLQEQ